jgi:uncharacterized repeat protein (TIGR03806 family)
MLLHCAWLRRPGSCAVLAVTALAALSCSSQRSVQLHLEPPFPAKLSAWHLFRSTFLPLRPNQGVLPYDLNTPLFSDYASKYRFVWMPPGNSAYYRDDSSFEFPIGTILIKTFAFPADGSASEKLIETRLLVHTQSEWKPLTYIWNEAQTEAVLEVVPDPVKIKFTSASGKRRDFTYVIPNANECHECHDNQKILLPIGPKARNLNKDYAYSEGAENQLDHWARVGYLQGLPAPSARPRAAKWDDPGSGSLDARARVYLDNNCAHCHQPGGQAGYTGVDFRLTQHEISQQGLCKSPNSAGFVGALRFDLVPGHPDDSILIYRLESIVPKISMPALSRDIVHEEGVQLLREWISSLPGACSSAGTANRIHSEPRRASSVEGVQFAGR